jgi:hypothetical protein
MWTKLYRNCDPFTLLMVFDAVVFVTLILWLLI